MQPIRTYHVFGYDKRGEILTVSEVVGTLPLAIDRADIMSSVYDHVNIFCVETNMQELDWVA